MYRRRIINIPPERRAAFYRAWISDLEAVLNVGDYDKNLEEIANLRVELKKW